MSAFLQPSSFNAFPWLARHRPGTSVCEFVWSTASDRAAYFKYSWSSSVAHVPLQHTARMSSLRPEEQCLACKVTSHSILRRKLSIHSQVAPRVSPLVYGLLRNAE